MDMRLFHGDCLSIMDDLIAKNVKVDAVITDPPYLIGYKTNYRKDKSHRFCNEIENDRNFDFEAWASKINMLLKDDAPLYIFMSWKTEPFFREIFAKYWIHKNNIIWVKNNWTAGDLNAQYGQQYEIIGYYNKGRIKLRDRRFADVWNFDRVAGNQQIHQNQKPVPLLERIIRNNTDKNDTIIDPFMGSGTTGAACKKQNRNFIGIELTEYYYGQAQKYIMGTLNKLF